MSDLRYDPINDQWVSVAKNRRERPMEFSTTEQVRQQIICPFCKGNEEETPQALAVYREDGSLLNGDDDPLNWTARVVPNLYPSFSQCPDPSRNQPLDLTPGNNGSAWGPYHSVPPRGVQELVIPTSRHVTSLSELTDAELSVSFRAYRDRLEFAKSLEYVKHAMLFMNCRFAAGASIGHIHTQLIGSPVISGFLKSRVERNEAHVRKHGCSMLESVTKWELANEARIVEVTDNFCIVCPFASRFAFQVWIVPLDGQFNFQSCSTSLRDELANHCRRIVSRFESLLDNPGYNMLLHTDPFELTDTGQCYFELFPRLTKVAGFEWGTDIWINPVAPETAARRLRVED